MIERRTTTGNADGIATGVIDSIQEDHVGSFTRSLASAGATSLPIKDMADFNESGGIALIDELEVRYSAAVSDDDAGDSLTLLVALLADVAAQTPVYASPVRRIRKAQVVLDGTSTSVTAIVPAEQWDDTRLAEGSTGGQPVELMAVGITHWIIVRPVGSALLRDTASWDPESHPPAGPIADAFQTQPNVLARSVDPGAIGDGSLPPGVKVGGLEHDEQGVRAIIPGAAGGASFDIPVDGRPPRMTGVLVDAERVATHAGGQAGGEWVSPPGSSWRLAAGTLDPPPIAPGGTPSWLTIDLALSMKARARSGFGIKSLTEAYCATVDRSGQARLVIFDMTTGAQTDRAFFSGAPTRAALISLSYSSWLDRVVTLEWDGAALQWLVRYWHTDGTYDFQWIATELGRALDPKPAIGVLGFAFHEFLIIARARYSDGKVDLIHYEDQVYASTITTLDSFATTVTGFDVEADARAGGTIILTFDCNMVLSSGAYPDRPVMPVVNLTFVGAPGETIGYLCVGNSDPASYVACWDADPDQRTFVLSAVTNQVVEHSNVQEAGHYWVSASWTDSGSGTESKCSTPTRLDKIPGSVLTVAVAPPPPGAVVDGINVYMGRESVFNTYPGDAAMFYQGTSATGEWFLKVLTVLLSGPTPPAVGDAIGGPAAPILADDGTPLLAGDKTGLLFDLIAAGGGGGSSGGRTIDGGVL